MSENEQQEVMNSVVALSTVETPRMVIEREVTVEDDVKRAWRRGWTKKKIQQRFGGTTQWITDLVKHTKRKGDINRNNILIIQDYSKGKDKDGRPKRTFYPKKD